MIFIISLVSVYFDKPVDALELTLGIWIIVFFVVSSTSAK